MWDNGGRMIFAPYPDYEDLILQRQEEIEIAEETGELDGDYLDYDEEYLYECDI